MNYYETTARGETVSHKTLEDAIQYANENNDVFIICEIGGNWDEYEKCTFCGEWVESSELNIHGECERCVEAIKSHGGF